MNWTVNEEDGYHGLGSPGSSVYFKIKSIIQGGIAISVQPSMYRSPEEFRNFYSSFANYFAHDGLLRDPWRDRNRRGTDA